MTVQREKRSTGESERLRGDRTVVRSFARYAFMARVSNFTFSNNETRLALADGKGSDEQTEKPDDRSRDGYERRCPTTTTIVGVDRDAVQNHSTIPWITASR